MKQGELEKLLQQGTFKERLEVARIFRTGYQAITNKYGSMVDYGKAVFDGALTADSMNEEIIRRDKVLYRFVRRYGR